MSCTTGVIRFVLVSHWELKVGVALHFSKKRGSDSLTRAVISLTDDLTDLLCNSSRDLQGSPSL